MAKVSVLIPSRNEPFLPRTIDDIFAKATGEIEILVMLDGYWPVPVLKDRPNLILVHVSEPRGNIYGINALVNIASGQYIMKTDAHCMFGEGFDEILQVDCDYEWLAVPSRYQLLAETWERGRGPIDYLYLTYPYLPESQFGGSLHGKKWQGETGLKGEYFYKERVLKDALIDDIMAFQGSCWFMHRARFLELGGYDPYFYHFQEPQAIGMKVWLADKGRCVRNKKTWYAHMHKGKQYGRFYYLSKSQCVDEEIYSADFWMHDRWQHPLKTRDVRWYVEHFWPIPGWPEDWDDPKYEQAFVHPGLRGNGR